MEKVMKSQPTPSSPRRSTRFTLLVRVALSALLLCSVAFAQTTIGTGSITGTITDPTGAMVGGAKVAITNTGTGQSLSLTANPAGAYTSGALDPGTYKVQVSAKGFSSVTETIGVEVGNTATANMKLQVGQESQVIEVQAATAAV